MEDIGCNCEHCETARAAKKRRDAAEMTLSFYGWTYTPWAAAWTAPLGPIQSPLLDEHDRLIRELAEERSQRVKLTADLLTSWRRGWSCGYSAGVAGCPFSQMAHDEVVAFPRTASGADAPDGKKS